MTLTQESRSAAHRIGLVLFSAALLLRMLGTTVVLSSAFEARVEIIEQPDTRSYRELGIDLIDGCQEEPSKRMPLYPLLLGVTGDLPEGSGGTVTVLLQQLLDLAAALVVGATAARFVREAFWPAAGACLLVPASVIHSLMLLPDSLMVLVCTMTGYLWIRTVQSSNYRERVLLTLIIGMLLSVGTAVKPILSLAWVVYAILILSQQEIPRRMKPLLVVLMFVYAGAFGWAWKHHNRESFGLDAISTQTTSDPFERVLILSGEAGWDRVARDSLVTAISAPALTEDGWDWAVRDSIFKNMMWTLIREQPFRIALPHFISWPGFFKPGTNYFEDASIFSENPLVFTSLRIISMLIALSLAGLFVLTATVRELRSKAYPLVNMALVWFVFTALVAGPAARAPRYGLTFFWVFAATSGISLAWLAKRK